MELSLQDLYTIVAKLRLQVDSLQVGTWIPVIPVDHGMLSGLDHDDHPQYLNNARHDDPARHTLGVVVPHDDHGLVTGLADDDHTQYLNLARHDLTARHTLGTVVPHDTLDAILNPVAAKLFTHASLYLKHTWTNPVAGGGVDGAFELEATGNFTGDLAHFHQHTGSPGGSTDVLHTEATASGVLALRAIHAGTGTVAIFTQNAQNILTITNQLNSRSIIPQATDTYDLGSSTLLWRKGWLSELDTIVFAKNTIQLIGGWFYVTKDEGTLPGPVLAGDLTIDFGQAMTLNDFVLFRGGGNVEYMKVGSLITGTTYNVTRNLDATSANDWPQGSAFCVLGGNGNGRIELNANSTPRISVIKQGATYNAQTEVIRLGDLNGWDTVGTERYGIGIGDFAGGNYLRYEPAGGFVVKGGAGAVNIDANGVEIAGSGAFLATNSIKFTNAGARIFDMWLSCPSPNMGTLIIESNLTGTVTSGLVTVRGSGSAGGNASLSAVSGAKSGYVAVAASAAGAFGTNRIDIVTQDYAAIQAANIVLTGTTATAIIGPLTINNTTKVVNLHADLLDGLHAGNASGNIPINNGTVNVGLNSDSLQGFYPGNSSGNLAKNNTTVNTDLNADMVDGHHITPWTNLSIGFTGFSSNPSGYVARYCIIAKMVTLVVEMPNAGTSNANTFTITGVPQAATVTSGFWRAPALITDNGAVQTTLGRVLIASAQTTITVQKNTDSTVLFTTSGGKAARFTLVYEGA